VKEGEGGRKEGERRDGVSLLRGVRTDVSVRVRFGQAGTGRLRHGREGRQARAHRQAGTSTLA
jgi:hypothetical protein